MRAIKRIALITLAAVLLLSGCRSGNSGRVVPDAAGSKAETWAPDREVRVIVAWPPGSGTDTSARLLLANAHKYVGQILAVENLDGANGKFGFTALAAAKPDGHTLGFIDLPTFTTLALEPDSPFTIADIAPVCNHLTEPAVIAVAKDSPYSTLQELVEACKAERLKCATDGSRAFGHTGAQLFARAAGFEYIAAPYDGGAEQLAALQQEKADFSVLMLGDVIALAMDENAAPRVLAVFSQTRLADYPELPTLKELGLDVGWYGGARALVAPGGTPQAAIDFYIEAFKKTMADEKCISDHEEAGFSMDYKSPDGLRELLLAQDAFCREVVLPLY